MDIISRAEWGARAPRSHSTVDWADRTEFVVHYSEGPPSQSVRSIQDFHMDGRGWADIGYNFLVNVDGQVYEGRGWLTVGAHAPGHNSSGIGVCMIGRDGDATAAAERSIRALYDEAGRRTGRPLKKLGHRDVYSTSCPGDQLYAWVRAGMPAAGLEDDDMQPTDKVLVGTTYDEDFAHDSYPASYLWVGSYAEAKRSRLATARIEAQLAAQAVTIDKLVDAIGAAQPDLDALKASIREAIEGINVRLDVADEEPPA